MTARNLHLGGIVLAVSLLACASAFAGDWSIKAVSSNELNIARNRGLSDPPKGFTAEHVSDFALDFNYTMPDGHFNIEADVRTKRQLSSGFETDYFPRLHAEWSKSDRDDTFKLFANYRIQELTLEDIIAEGIPDLGIPPVVEDVPTIQHVASVGATWVRKVNQRNTLTYNSVLSATEYDAPSDVATDYQSWNNSLDWDHKLTRRTDLSTEVALNWLVKDDKADTNQLVYSLDTDITHRFNPRWTGRIGAGVSIEQLVRDGKDTEYDESFSFNTGLRYAMKRTTFDWSLQYGVAQAASGSLQKQFSTALTVNHTINERSSIAATARYVTGPGEFDDSIDAVKTFFFTPTYNLALTREWDLKAGYRYIHRDTETESASSNTVFVSLDREFVILP